MYYRDYLSKIWRNSKIHDCQPILENYRHWLLILRAPPKRIIVAERTRSYLAISRTNSGFTTSNTRSKPKSHQLTYPVPRAKLIAVFQMSSYLGLQWRNRLLPQLRISPDLMGHTGESVQTPGKPKSLFILPRISERITQRNRL